MAAASPSLIFSASSSRNLSFTSLKKPCVDCSSSLFLGLHVPLSCSRRHFIVPPNQRWRFQESEVDGPDIWNDTRYPKAKDHGKNSATYMGASVISGRFRSPATRPTHHGFQVSCRSVTSLLAVTASATVPAEAAVSSNEVSGIARAVEFGLPTRSDTLPDMIQALLLADLDPASAKLAIGILGPFLSAFAFLFILRIVMSWYPKLPVGKFPYILAYAPTEPLLIPTRKLIPPVGGVDVTPVVWFAIVSFLNEIFVGPQGLLVLVSQQVS